MENSDIPPVADDEILLVESPVYLSGTTGSYPVEKIAHIIKKNVPNAKFLVILCDPAKRLYSHLKHMTISQGKKVRYFIFSTSIEKKLIKENFTWYGEDHKSLPEALEWFLDVTNGKKILKGHEIEKKFLLMKTRSEYMRNFKPYGDIFSRFGLLFIFFVVLVLQ